MSNNKKVHTRKKSDELVYAEKYAPKSPNKTKWGRVVIVILCAAMVVVPLIACICALFV